MSLQSAQSQSQTVSEIEQWIVNRLAEELRVGRERIDVEHPILSLGIDSMHLVSVIAALEDWSGTRFSENPLEDHPTIKKLSKFVGEMISERGGGA